MKFGDLDEMSLADFVATAPKDALWFFLHIPKTAGSSLSAELDNYTPPYRNIFVDNYDPQISFADAEAAAIDAFISDIDFSRYRSASGHMRWNVSRRLRETRANTQYFSVLRDPIKRVVSDYRYQRTPAHPPYKRFIEKFPSLESFAEIPNARNKMARFLTGKLDPSIEETLQIVDEEFAFIGLLEMYPLSFNIIFQLMGVPGCLPKEHQRKTPDNDVTRVEMTPEIRSWIAEINPVDAALYDHVHRRLLARRAEWAELMRAERSKVAAQA